ncbi:uncharacterized protein [Nicotiana sylvestris]|uniref:uncharacterized protein n=1 Tax=Nicotiana sylvestris TaxID=4096 RepID=UPI00388C944B
MYHDLKEIYWWNNTKKDVADFVAKCPNCQQVKAEHRRPGGLAESIEIPIWKWEMINMYFVPQTDGRAERTIQTLEDMLHACTLDSKGSWDDHLPLIKFAYNNSFHASIQIGPFEALYSRRCFPYERHHAVQKGGKIESEVVGDPSSIVPVETIEVNQELSYEDVQVAILHRLQRAEDYTMTANK